MFATSPSKHAKSDLPDANRVAAFRTYLEGIDARACVERCAPNELTPGRSARGVLGIIRRELVAAARERHRDDWAELLGRVQPASSATTRRKVGQVLPSLSSTPVPSPQLDDAVSRWLPATIAVPLSTAGIRTWAELAARMSRKVGWWRDIDGVGVQSAKRISDFIVAHAALQNQIAVFFVPIAGVETCRLANPSNRCRHRKSELEPSARANTQREGI